jgi:hypothetical protein
MTAIRSDVILFEFLLQYFQRLEGPVAIQVWGRFLQLAKEIISGTRDFKPQNLHVLRLVIYSPNWSSSQFSLRIQLSLRAGGQDYPNNGYR